jgi:hypothetical protein
MSSTVPNYSKTSIYKLCCKDPHITDIYVGHTTNFRNRKTQHKTCCNRETSHKHNLYVYQYIREHGGFENWDMIEICNIECIDKRDAERNERKYIEDLGASLNQNIPTRTIKEWLIDNKERITEPYRTKNMEWRKNNREKHNETSRKYNSTPQRQEYSKNYRDTHKKEISEYHKNKRIEKGEQAILDRRNYYNNNKEYLCMKERERYAKKKLLKESIKETIKEDIKENV